MTAIDPEMPVYFARGKRLERAKEEGFALERDMQRIVESNLQEAFSLELIRSEFDLKGMRIDTLAFDPEGRSFAILEFKKDRSFSVVDQGYAYLALALNNKADLVLEYNEKLGRNLKKNDIDWSQTRVLFISPEFTKHQRGAIEFKDLPIELWEIRRYEKGIMVIDNLKPSETSASVATLSAKSPKIREVTRQVKVYSESDHLKGVPADISEVFDEMKQRLLNLGDVEMVPRSLYIGFKRATTFADIHIYKSQITMWLNVKKGELDDPKGFARDVSGVGHWGNGDYELVVKPDSDLDYVMMLAKYSHSIH